MSDVWRFSPTDDIERLIGALYQKYEIWNERSITSHDSQIQQVAIETQFFKEATTNFKFRKQAPTLKCHDFARTSKSRECTNLHRIAVTATASKNFVIQAAATQVHQHNCVSLETCKPNCQCSARRDGESQAWERLSLSDVPRARLLMPNAKPQRTMRKTTNHQCCRRYSCFVLVAVAVTVSTKQWQQDSGAECI